MICSACSVLNTKKSLTYFRLEEQFYRAAEAAVFKKNIHFQERCHRVISQNTPVCVWLLLKSNSKTQPLSTQLSSPKSRLDLYKKSFAKFSTLPNILKLISTRNIHSFNFRLLLEFEYIPFQDMYFPPSFRSVYQSMFTECLQKFFYYTLTCEEV